MAEPCPRCGTERDPVEDCPECGYEPDHPGVLGAYRRAAARLIKRPSLAVPFLLPAALLFGAETVFSAAPTDTLSPGIEAAATVGALLVVITWYLEAIALTTSALARGGFPDWPSPGVHEASLTGAVVVTAPWAAVVGLVAWSPQGALGGIALLGVFVLLIAGVFATGRAVGLPVEAALGQGDGRRLLADGNRRAREMGGLGLVFLGFLLLVLPGIGFAVLQALEIVQLSAGVDAGLRAVVRWILGSWIGTALALGLGGTGDVTRTFTCPACGREATLQSGRARCSCGIEGPFYEA